MTRNRAAAAVLLLAAIAVVAFVALRNRDTHGEPDEDVGFVLSISGEWVDTNSHPLALGTALRGGTIRRSGEHGEIVVALLDDTVRSCDCPSLELPSTLAKDAGAGQRVFGAVKALFANRPERFATAMSRAESLHESIAKIDAGSIDISPALAEMPAGTISVRFALPESDTPVLETTVDWKPGSPAIVSGAVSPGLVTLTVDPPGASAWLLVLGPGNYDRIATAWSDAHTKAGALPPEARRPLLRAWLEKLSRE